MKHYLSRLLKNNLQKWFENKIYVWQIKMFSKCYKKLHFEFWISSFSFHKTNSIKIKHRKLWLKFTYFQEVIIILMIILTPKTKYCCRRYKPNVIWRKISNWPIQIFVAKVQGQADVYVYIHGNLLWYTTRYRPCFWYLIH